VTSHGHLDHIGGLVTKTGALAFPKAQFVFVDTEWNYWTGSRYESEVNSSSMPDPFKMATIGAARENLPPVADRSRFVKQGGEITSGVQQANAGEDKNAAAAIDVIRIFLSTLLCERALARRPAHGPAALAKATIAWL
jgi:hypothetical protein